VTLEGSDEPVTEGWVEGVLAWIDEDQGSQWRLNGKNCVACPIRSESLVHLISVGLFAVKRN
jgi:hypothetical protein